MSPDNCCKLTFRRFSQFINTGFIFPFLMLAALAITVPLISKAQNSITVKQIELPKPFDQAEVKTLMADSDGFLNLFNNAFYAVNQKAKTAGPDYKPEVTVTTFAPLSGGLGAKSARQWRWHSRYY